MHNDKTTSIQLTCYAPALTNSVYQSRVYVNGDLIPLYQYVDPTRAFFIPSSSQTPTITGISPLSGTPITLFGSFQTSCYSRDVDARSDDGDPLINNKKRISMRCSCIQNQEIVCLPSLQTIEINTQHASFQMAFTCR